MTPLAESGNALTVGAQLEILRDLAARGALTVAEMPRRWPVTRMVVERAVTGLLAQELAYAVPSPRIPGQTAYALTARGRVVLAAYREGMQARAS